MAALSFTLGSFLSFEFFFILALRLYMDDM